MIERIRASLFGGLLLASVSASAQMHHTIDPADATAVAQSSGAWSEASTWGGALPDGDDIVLIPAGIEVSFGAAAEIQDLLIQGALRFDAQADTSLLVETIEVGMMGALEIGRIDAPIAPEAQVEIVFRSEGELDPANDPDLIRRGLLGHGPVTIHGADKTVHLKVAVDPRAGDTTLALAEAPKGWQVGDTIVLTGTTYSGWRWDNDIQSVRYFGTRDAVRQITAIDGAEITLDAPLDHDHTTPRADLKASVANFSRNVTFRNSQDDLPAHRRAHVMLMHATHFDVRYAAFWQLGRTDKSVESFALDQLDTLAPDSNVRGRYPLHFHITGIDDPRTPAIALGNAVFGSPGWGYVHHASNAVFHNNASFDTHGAGFVAETGDEIGTWVDNIAIKAEGNSAFNPKNGVDVASFDMARTGSGFWFQGRMVRSTGNIAASVNQGFAYLHRGSRMRDFPNTAFMLPEALRRDRPASPDDAPILNFHDNEAFASAVGLFVVKANPNQQHDIHSHFSDFTAWEVRGGSNMEYTSHYLLEDFDIIGKTPEPFSGPQFGIEFGNNTSDMVIRNARMQNVAEGVRLGKGFTNSSIPPEANQYVVIDAEFIDVDTEYVDLDPTIDTIISSDELVPGRMAVNLNNGAPLEYLSPATNAGVGLDFIGEKLDSIGPTPIPAGTDNIGVPNYEMIAICEQDGYYRDAEGTPWVIVEEYFTDRATGTIHKIALPVRLGPEVDALLGNPFHAWRDAFERGLIDFDNQPPAAGNDQALTDLESDVIIDVLSNDADTDGDPLQVDGIVQPDHGLVFDNGDGTLTYRPDFDYEGLDRFTYWVSDGQGHFTPAEVSVRVSGDLLFIDRFE